MEGNRVIVIGAGIIGLQVACSLLEANINVIVIAEHFPGDEATEYTSPWAGAHWRPHSSVHEVIQCAWDLETYHHWLNIIEYENEHQLEDDEKSGLAMRTSTLIRDTNSEMLWFSRYVRDFHQSDVPPAAGRHQGATAATFTSVAVNVPKYLKYMEAKIRKMNGIFIRYKLNTFSLDETLNEAAGLSCDYFKTREDDINYLNSEVLTFVNASGIGAREICKDRLVYPIRGQVVLVKGEAKRIITQQGIDPNTQQPYIAYAIPRPGSGTTVLGGCNQHDNWNGDVDPAITAQILERARILVPNLLKPLTGGHHSFEVLREMVGLRPARKGGPRVEIEFREKSQISVIHCYGHGGAGYQNSVGVANSVLKLIGSLCLERAS